MCRFPLHCVSKIRYFYRYMASVLLYRGMEKMYSRSLRNEFVNRLQCMELTVVHDIASLYAITVLFLLHSQYWNKLHRIIELLELKDTFKGHLVQLLCSEQGHLELGRLLIAPSSLTLHVSKDGASTTSLGNLFQCL